MANIRRGREGLGAMVMSSVLDILSLKCLTGNPSGSLKGRGISGSGSGGIPGSELQALVP